MELRDLRFFVAVADERHFGRAAARLLVAQPAVSKHIARFERTLGFRLFDRTSRQVNLTPEGEDFLIHAHRVLAAVDAAQRMATEIAGGAGTLRIGTSGELGEYLNHVLDQVRRAHPAVVIDLLGGTTPHKVAAVRSGGLDAAFVRAARPVPGVRLIHLWDEPLQAFVPAGGGETLSAVATLPLRRLRREVNPGLFDLFTDICRGHGFEPVEGPELQRLPDAVAGDIASRRAWTFAYARTSTPAVEGVDAVRIVGHCVPTSLAVGERIVGAPLEALVTTARESVQGFPHQ